MSKILCICLSSTLQRSITFPSVELTKVNRSQKYRIDASGKAVNSARVLSQIEKNCAKVICPLGKENSQLFIDLLKKDNVSLEYVEIPGFTRECWTLLDSKNGTTTELVVSEPALNQPLPTETQDFSSIQQKFFELIKTSLPAVDAVLLAGSKPAIWSEGLYAKISELVLQNKKIFLADYWSKDLLLTLQSSIPSIIKINDEEFSKTFNLSENPEDDELKNAICKKSAELKNIIVVTRGTKPTFAAQNGTFYSCPCKKVHAINTTACGDSFNSGFLYEYLISKDIQSALEKGTWAASQNAQSECPGSVIL